MSTKSTPRPWHYYLAPRGHNWIIAGPNDEAVGAAGTEANAALIAAAPQTAAERDTLRDACQAVLRHFDECAIGPDTPEILRLAIAEATPDPPA